MRCRGRGFTLLEVLVVLALVALLVGTVAPAMSRWLDSARERGWRSDLESVLRAQPVLAFRAGAAVAVTDKALRSAMTEAPDDLVIELPQPLRYSAAGVAEGGELRVARRGQLPERWRVLPVTGDVQRDARERP
jgi:prepilin-type N-terminal cleavage/methylation domain-containing protein